MPLDQIELENGEIIHYPTGKQEAIKHDDDKLPWDLLPWDAVEEIVKVLHHGAKKYTPRNWERGFRWGRVYAALIRHLVAWSKGEDNDPDSGFSHLAHAGCCLLFLLTFVKRGTGRDDRSRNTTGT